LVSHCCQTAPGGRTMHMSQQSRAGSSSHRSGSIHRRPTDALPACGTRSAAAMDAGSAGSDSLRYRSESENTQGDSGLDYSSDVLVLWRLCTWRKGSNVRRGPILKL